jgi:glutamate 5-kinase
VEGRFGRLEPVRLLASDGRELGRGLSTLSSEEVEAIMGMASDEVRRRLGPVGDAVVHRDQLVLTPGAEEPGHGQEVEERRCSDEGQEEGGIVQEGERPIH